MQKNTRNKNIFNGILSSAILTFCFAFLKVVGLFYNEFYFKDLVHKFSFFAVAQMQK
jgi:hypothetical protein